MTYNTAYLEYKEESLKITTLREAKTVLKSEKSRSLDKNLSPQREKS